jgi:sulfur-carrier protein adenylyltransferase/sulfurtransferase
MVEEWDPESVAARLRAGKDPIVLLDVREPYERELAVIDPSVHIPMGEVPERVGEIPRDRTVVVYCHGGGRSAMIAAYLEGQGYAHVANLSGGIDAWSVTVDPKVPRYG